MTLAAKNGPAARGRMATAGLGCQTRAFGLRRSFRHLHPGLRIGGEDKYATRTIVAHADHAGRLFANGPAFLGCRHFGADSPYRTGNPLQCHGRAYLYLVAAVPYNPYEEFRDARQIVSERMWTRSIHRFLPSRSVVCPAPSSLNNLPLCNLTNRTYYYTELCPLINPSQAKIKTPDRRDLHRDKVPSCNSVRRSTTPNAEEESLAKQTH